MELGGEWFLFYRSAREMIALTEKLSGNNTITIEDDGKINFNKFINIQKK